MLVGEVHYHLPGISNVAHAALGEDDIWIQVVEAGSGLDYHVEVYGVLLHLDRVPHHFVCEVHVYRYSACNGIGYQAHYDAFELSHRAVCIVGNDIDNVLRQVQSVVFRF